MGRGATRRTGDLKGVEVNHWGARLRTDTYRGYNGYLIQVGRYRVLFAGDTADTHKLTRIAGSKRLDMIIMPSAPTTHGCDFIARRNRPGE